MPLTTINKTTLAELAIMGLAAVKLIMIISSFDIPIKVLGIIKKTKSNWLKMFLAKAGMFFDCPICLSVVSAIITVFINYLNPIINLILAVSVLGLFIKKKTIDR